MSAPQAATDTNNNILPGLFASASPNESSGWRPMLRV
jgi:hypothetical protein